MIFRPYICKAMFKKSFQNAYSNPTAYVFMTMFIAASAILQYSWGDTFFLNNLAELSPLNEHFPLLLLFFIPVLSMNVWAEEKKLSTEEFLLTLPATEFEIIIGKFLGLILQYFVSLILTTPLLIMLYTLGNPDLGMLFGNYLSYMLLGSAMISVSMVASILTSNSTVAFILGVVFNAILMFVGTFLDILSSVKGLGFLARAGLEEQSGLLYQFQENVSGLLTFNGVFYFLFIIVIMLYLNMVLIKKRHWATGSAQNSMKYHYALRTIFLLIILVTMQRVLSYSAWRADLTSEKLYSFSDSSKKLISTIDKPVFIEAYISHEVPQNLVETRKNVLNTLRELEAVSNGKVQVNVHKTEAKSKEARNALDKYNIKAQKTKELKDGQVSIKDIYLSAAISCGANQEIIPQFSPGIPVEYELTRTIRVVNESQRKKLGVLMTDAELIANRKIGFFERNTEWQIVKELRKQYNVTVVDPKSDYPDDLDVLLAVLPSSLTQKSIDRLQSYVLSGGKTLILDDPLPIIDPFLSPNQLSKSARRDTAEGKRVNLDLKGDIESFYRELGIEVEKISIAFSSYNPHPTLANQPPEFLFMTGAQESFNDSNAITKDLQELLMIYSGHMDLIENSWTQVTPLIQSSKIDSGNSPWGTHMETAMGALPPRFKDRSKIHNRFVTNKPQIVAAEISGERDYTPEVSEEEKAKEDFVPPKAMKQKVDAIVVTDIDFISDIFFNLRSQGSQQFNFNNVSFVLNAIDRLAGDDSFIALRSRHRKHRTLTYIDNIRTELVKERTKIIQDAEVEAAIQLQNAQRDLDIKLSEIEKNTELKKEDKERMLATVKNHHSQLFAVKRQEIKLEQDNKVRDAEENVSQQLNQNRQKIILMSTVLPPLLPFFIGLIIFALRRKREMTHISENRLKEAK